jgi:hypothetical protein
MSIVPHHSAMYKSAAELRLEALLGTEAIESIPEPTMVELMTIAVEHPDEIDTLIEAEESNGHETEREVLLRQLREWGAGK